MYLMNTIVLPFVIAFVSGLLLFPVVRKTAIRMGIVDRPNRRKIHSVPIPRVGGIAIFVASILGALPFLDNEIKVIGMLAAGTFIFITGLLDDVMDLKPNIKLAGQIVAVTILFFFNVRIDFVTDFFAGEGLVALGLFAYPITILWVVGITNTVNLIDGVDGLAGGVVLIALSTLLAVRMIEPQTQEPLLMKNVLIMTTSLMGSLAVFLRFNMFPAKIFMGDAGAYYLGFMIASLSIAGAAKGSILLPLVVPLIALGLPVLDVIFAIARRIINHVPIFQADKEHLHHRLLNIGFSQKETTKFFWMVSICFGLLAILSSGLAHKGVATTVTVLLVIMASVATRFFLKRYHAERKSSNF
ncbi:MAG: undecaprenyl/decaprenyl-phosphate alpha-N-acetylglucosaminyl 1-phosphate transferase [Candidatus Riflebacteria bacterium]|nr:undecaprenyl/decaprenyl-phosphate alpha-N-acetylglucosaminyl 1-phosphate transferase [Candidatus Riflebacteria bacterium]